jgi:hypothetical protein
MTVAPTRLTAAATLAALLVAGLALPASAISVELAKKCREEAIKAHPTAPAGSLQGSARAQRDTYEACIQQNNNAKSDDHKGDDHKGDDYKPAPPKQ